MEGVADSVMLVSEPFAVAYGLEALLHALVIDIGAGTADFCVMQGRYPTEEDQKTLTTAGDSVDEQLVKLVRERYPDVQFSIHMIREWKEKWSFVGEPKDRVLVTAPIKGKAMEIDVTQEMRAACESILPPICETLITLADESRAGIPKQGPQQYYSGRRQLAHRRLAGRSHERRLKSWAADDATVVKDPVFAGSDGGLAIARDASTADWEKLSL